MPVFFTRYNENMYTDFYTRISKPWRTKQNGAALLTRIDLWLRIAVAAAYIGMLLWLFVTQSPALLRAIVVPLTAFVLVTGLRIAINAPRPYEAFAIDPLIHKSTRGKSMPSRHMASATIIACTMLWALGPLWGVVGFIACVAIAYVRIVGGVHFPRDIAVAATISIVAAIVGFVVIP